MSKRKPRGLKVAETLYVWTALGEREIQLLFGDITALPVEDTVDFVFVSAFPGDYSVMRHTAVGALHHNLGLSVRELACDKKEDLRRQFHCWISKSLKKSFPYRQLVCFERTRTPIGHGSNQGDTKWHNNISQVQNQLTDAVKEVFRAMMPAFNNANKSVITPLLATGHQRADEMDMLKTMVTTAAKWMWLGMPLQTLKIVVYCLDPDKPSSDAVECLKTFKVLKSKIEPVKNIPKEPAIILDIFLIFSQCDADDMSSFTKHLKKQHNHLKIRTRKDIQEKEDSWQNDLFNVMLTSARVVPLLSAQFLLDMECIDQFNVALCCNRRTKRHLLAPVLLERLMLPSYMNMVQWMNCRNKSEEEFTEVSVSLMTQVKAASAPVKTKYDVFISYSHKNIAVARQFLEVLEALNPKPRVFFDYEVLTTGVAWQETLYQAIDNSCCVVALLSPDYLQSAVCQEEINLAIAKHLGKDKSLELLPVCFSDVTCPSLFQFIQPVRLDKTTITDICGDVGKWLSKGNSSLTISAVAEPLDYVHSTAIIRDYEINQNYSYQDGSFTLSDPGVLPDNPNDIPKTICYIYISHSVRDQKYATFLVEYLHSINPNIQVFDKSRVSGHETGLLDSAHCLVVLLSTAYINSKREVEEFNIILSRERQSKNRRLLYVIKLNDLTIGPTYFSIVPCDTSFTDDLWWDLAAKNPDVCVKNKKVLAVVTKKAGAVNVDEVLPLLKACCDLNKMYQCGSYIADIRHSDVILDNIIAAHLEAEAIVGTNQDHTSSASPLEDQHSAANFDPNSASQIDQISELSVREDDLTEREPNAITDGETSSVSKDQSVKVNKQQDEQNSDNPQQQENPNKSIKQPNDEQTHKEGTSAKTKSQACWLI